MIAAVRACKGKPPSPRVSRIFVALDAARDAKNASSVGATGGFRSHRAACALRGYALVVEKSIASLVPSPDDLVRLEVEGVLVSLPFTDKKSGTIAYLRSAFKALKAASNLSRVDGERVFASVATFSVKNLAGR